MARQGRKEIRIQDGFLFGTLKEGRLVALLLTSGEAISGRLKRFDRHVLLIETRTKEILVYKHAITGLVSPSPEPA